MTTNLIKRVQYKFVELRAKFLQRIIMHLVNLLNYYKPIKKNIDFSYVGNAKVGKLLTEGHYIFSGVQFELDVDNPWRIELPSTEVEQDLYGFSWLNDLAAYGNSNARKRAIDWIKNWNFYNSVGKTIGSDPYVTALRCLNLIRNWNFLQRGLGSDQSETLKYLWRQYKFLRLTCFFYPVGLKKLQILHSIFLLAFSYGMSRYSQKKMVKQMCRLLKRLFDTNGHMFGRNPEDLLNCFVILVEILNINRTNNYLTQADLKVLRIIEKINAPILRGLRLGNGSLTRSHGGDMGCNGEIDKYLVASNVKAPSAITNMLGFERINAGRLVLIVDCARPDDSIQAFSPHASCLSFELSSGQRPIFVNCGPGGRFGTAYKRYCRSTQAHNSCCLGDISQLEFAYLSRKKRWPKEMIVDGPRNISVSRHKTLEATWLNLSHDSYEKKYGYIHHRKLLMLNSGKVFSGTDSFEINNHKKVMQKKVDKFYAYFHLHPDVELWDHPRLQTIILRLRNGEHWIFESDLGVVNIEDSSFINSAACEPQKTKRIVIKSSTLRRKTEIKWSLRRREIVSRNTRDPEFL